MRKFFRIVMAILTAFLVIVIVSQALILIGPAVGGILVSILDLTPDEHLIKTMEASGNIIALAISIYIGIKIYRKVIGNQKNGTKIE